MQFPNYGGYESKNVLVRLYLMDIRRPFFFWFLSRRPLFAPWFQKKKKKSKKKNQKKIIFFFCKSGRYSLKELNRSIFQRSTCRTRHIPLISGVLLHSSRLPCCHTTLAVVRECEAVRECKNGARHRVSRRFHRCSLRPKGRFTDLGFPPEPRPLESFCSIWTGGSPEAAPWTASRIFPWGGSPLTLTGRFQFSIDVGFSRRASTAGALLKVGWTISWDSPSSHPFATGELHSLWKLPRITSIPELRDVWEKNFRSFLNNKKISEK